MSQPDRVLVTGATGFLAQHLLVRLARGGYALRATVRDAQRREQVWNTLARHGVAPGQLELVVADLTRDAHWDEAARGCTYVMHTASPVPNRQPRAADELVTPAREGTLRVLRAANAARARRVVLTSSLSAVVFNHGPRDGQRHSEADWTDLSLVGPYEKSKTLAERAAWDFVAQVRPSFELTTVNPGLILGPSLGGAVPASLEIVSRLLRGKLLGCPRIGWATADVRDVAEAHVRALEAPAAAAQRFCCAGQHVWLADMAEVLDRHYRRHGYQVPRRTLPDWLVRATSLVDPSTRMLVHKLGKRVDVSSARLRELLELSLRPVEESLLASADSLIAHAAL